MTFSTQFLQVRKYTVGKVINLHLYPKRIHTDSGKRKMTFIRSDVTTNFDCGLGSTQTGHGSSSMKEGVTIVEIIYDGFQRNFINRQYSVLL